MGCADVFSHAASNAQERAGVYRAEEASEAANAWQQQSSARRASGHILSQHRSDAGGHNVLCVTVCNCL